MKTVSLLAAVSMLALAPRLASASQLNFTFVGYCDGVSLDYVNTTQYAGTHDGSCEANDPIGGFKVNIVGIPFKITDLATIDTKNAPGVQLIYWLNVKGLTWDLYYVNGSAITFVTKGTLKRGKPNPNSTAPATSSGL